MENQYRLFIFSLVVFSTFFFPTTSYTQAYQDETIEKIICPDFLRYEEERYWAFEQRKIKSEILIAEAPHVLQGIVLKQIPKIIKDTLYMQILIDLEHSFRGGTLEDSIVSICRRIHQSESYKLINGKIEHPYDVNHSYNWDIRNGNRYIFFCDAFTPRNNDFSFKIYTNSRTSYLKEWPSKGWDGLFCMPYLDYASLMRHLKEFDSIEIPSNIEFYNKDNVNRN